MANEVNLIPYGTLADGSMGTGYRSDNNRTVAVAIEIWDTLPDVGSSHNFVGRTIFYTVDRNIYTFTNTPANAWEPVKSGVVTVDTAAPTDPGLDGELYYSTATEILYLYVGSVWVGIAGQLGSGVIWRFYTADGVASTFPSGSTQTPPVEYVQVFINGLAKRPGGSYDYSMTGNDVVMNATPSNGQLVSIRTLVFQNVVRNSSFFSKRYVSNGTVNTYLTGAQMVQPGQVLVACDGIIQVPDTGEGAGTYDYKIATQDNSVVSITRSGTTATMTTTVPHGLTASETVSVAGASQTAYNGNFTVLSAPTTTTLTFTVAGSPATPATGTMTYGPLMANDSIVFYNESGVATPLPTGVQVHIQTIETIVAQM